ncbi:MAG TPA: 50S ribosomal protein L10, partial [Gammaproteobacteria bacterium]|nr:50S ribosomal protein L10 [Gammaproteobacteria bacterium]
MPLTLQQKQGVVSDVAEVAAQAHSVIAAEYQGLTVGE